jgi:hypothetical protein
VFQISGRTPGYPDVVALILPLRTINELLSNVLVFTVHDNVYYLEVC